METMMKKLLMLTLLLTSLTLILSGCGGGKNNNQESRQAEYNIYYLDSKTSGIVSESYTPVGSTKEELVEELLNALKTEPKNVVYRRALPDTVTIREYEFSDDDGLIINFETNYNELTGIPEVLCRATIVKTLCQIPGVEYINFNVNGQPLIDSNNVKIGLMTAEDFIENTGAETQYKAMLYFGAAGGKTLIASEVKLYYTGNDSIEEMVINQLINGPTEIGMANTIPEGTTLLDVKTRERICYVDFNEKFLEAIPDISPETTIYSVVNSLVELPGINKVQFQINGALVETYQEKIPFNGFFERNLDVIEVGSK
jgi:germination protein M